MAIEDIDGLQRHLQTAIELEHSTLPPYLCALYSLHEGSNKEASAVLQSVVMEEMLHLTMAANILNAVGGKPILDARALVPGHPQALPHSDGSVVLTLSPFSKKTVEGFMAVERPAAAGSVAQDEGFATIGQFYKAIDEALVRLSLQLGEAALFVGDPTRQVTQDIYYGGAGRIITVTNLDTAREALSEIVKQGEGLDHQSILDGDKDMFHPERDEIGHYFRFEQLLLERAYARNDSPSSGPSGPRVAVDWSAVHPMTVNPRVADYPLGSAERMALESFNTSYCTVLRLLERTFNGVPAMLKFATGAMYGLKQQMIDLLRTPSGNGRQTLGPSFEWVPPEARAFSGTSVSVLPAGPYLMRGDIDVFDVENNERVHGGVCVLCRCGGSRTKPFCDGSHARFNFVGAEVASHDDMAVRRRAYPTTDGATVYDDRTRCAHFGQCTDRCPAAFGVSEDKFVEPSNAPSELLASVAAGCPSGALTFAPPGATSPVEERQEAAIRPIVDGPYRLRGGIQVVGGNAEPYEIRERQTLCRCGQSGNKPFCDGSHWYAGFRDPLPLDMVGVDPFPWMDPSAADRGREQYARDHPASNLRKT